MVWYQTVRRLNEAIYSSKKVKGKNILLVDGESYVLMVRESFLFSVSFSL